jgi:signal transduction histidine kinase
MEKFQSYLGIVENETDRCSKIVSNLLAFSRKSKEEVRKVSVREVVEKSVLLSQHKMALANIRLQTEFEEHLPVVLGDFNQIQQCVINLIFNAIDAMPEGGALTIACRSLEGEGILEIQVADSGTGISKQDLPHIFDAFYTTKTEGSGLGLGLATVYGIIERHKGSIDVESEPGKGTTFTIRLPALGKGDNANEAA